jgi:gliding motility-associated-like protein
LRSYFAPSTFNPNSENEANKEFSILFGKGIKGIELLRIYDRWGNLVHETNDNVWEGTFNGQAAQQSVYVFVATIRYSDDVTEQIKGDITLMR